MKKKTNKKMKAVTKKFNRCNPNTITAVTTGASTCVIGGLIVWGVNKLNKRINILGKDTNENIELLGEMKDVFVGAQNLTNEIVKDTKNTVLEAVADVGAAVERKGSSEEK